MKRVRLIIAYDGTNYCGWQVQINGITVEEVLNKALKDLLNEGIVISANQFIQCDVCPCCNGKCSCF